MSTDTWAREKAREIEDGISNADDPRLGRRIEAALLAARLAGWRGGREDAAKVMDNLGDKDKNDNLVNDALQWCEGYEIGCREGAAAIRAMPGETT